MENTPARIAADILIAAIEGKQIGPRNTPAQLAEAFQTLHAVVITAAEQDVDKGASYPHK